MNGLRPNRGVLNGAWTVTLAAGTLIALFGAAGCAMPNASPYATPSESTRDPIKANLLTRKSAGLIDSDPEAAEKLLREALAADLYHGPAHNNLGVIHLKRGDLYEAANEFEWARKLMPEQPDPRTNLALTLEKAGRQSEALEGYVAALQVRPEHMPTMQALTRLQIRVGKADEQTSGMLAEIALRGTTPRWREWAREQAIKLSPNQPE